MSTAQKVAVITGASQGIGAALVQAFRNRNYRSLPLPDPSNHVADPDIATVQGDVADPKTANLVFKEALDRFGRVDTLVNNAGMFMAKPFIAYSHDDYAAYMATNVTGFFHMTQRAIEMMNKQGRGHVVTVTTSLVDQPMTSVPAVLASLTKGALERRDEVARDRVCQKWRASECCLAGNYQDPDASARGPSGSWPRSIRWVAWEKFGIVDAVMYLDSAGFRHWRNSPRRRRAGSRSPDILRRRR